MTLIESMAAIAIGGTILGGSILMIKQSYEEKKIEDVSVGVIQTGEMIENLFSRDTITKDWDITRNLVDADEYSPRLKARDHKFYTPYGGRIKFVGTGNSSGKGFYVEINGLDEEKCSQIIEGSKHSLYTGFAVKGNKIKYKDANLALISSSCDGLNNGTIRLYKGDM